MYDILMSDEMVCAAPFLLIIVGAFLVGVIGTIASEIDRHKRNKRWKLKSKPWHNADGRRR